MDYTLLWIETLAASLLLLALTLAARTHTEGRGRLGVDVLSGLAGGIPGVLGILATIAAFALSSARIAPDWRLYAGSWLALYLAGLVLLLRRRTAAQWGLGPLAGATIAAWAALFVTYHAISDALDRRLLSLVTEQRAAALASMPARVPDRDNAALAYEQVFTQLRALDARKDIPKGFQQTGRAENPSEESATQVLDAAAPVIRLARRAAALPGYYYETDYVRPLRTALPSLLDFRRTANLLALDAARSAQRGDTTTAAADVAAILRMAEHVGAQPVLIGHMMRVALAGLGLDAIEDTLALAKTERPEDLASSAQAITDTHRAGLQRAFQFEESYFLYIVTNAYYAGGALGLSGGEDASLGERLLLAPGKLFLLPEDLASYDRTMGEMQGALADRRERRQQRLKKLSEDWDKESHGLLTAMALPSVMRADVSTAGVDARAALARVALAATAYRLKSRSYPARLEDLVPDYLPAVPIDPFADAPVKMIAADGGLVIYSVGNDGKDGAGAEKRRGAGLNEGDVTFCLGDAYAARRGAKPWWKPL